MIVSRQTVLIFTLIVGLLDRITKWWAYHYLQFQDISLCKGIDFSLTYNTGIAWSLFSHTQDIVQWSIILVTLGLLYQVALYTRERFDQGYCILAELLILVGGLSNVCDRFLYPGVVDFIKISYSSYTFPIFNVADVMVCAGVGLILYTHLFKK